MAVFSGRCPWRLTCRDWLALSLGHVKPNERCMLHVPVELACPPSSSLTALHYNAHLLLPGTRNLLSTVITTVMTRLIAWLQVLHTSETLLHLAPAFLKQIWHRRTSSWRGEASVMHTSAVLSTFYRRIPYPIHHPILSHPMPSHASAVFFHQEYSGSSSLCSPTFVAPACDPLLALLYFRLKLIHFRSFAVT